MDGYIRQEVTAETGLPARTIQFYTDQGLIVPDVENPVGRGTTRRYSQENIVELRIIEHLKRCGQSLKTIAVVMPYFREGKMRGQWWWSDAVSGTECREKAYLAIVHDVDKGPEVRFMAESVDSGRKYDSSGAKYDLQKYIGFKGESMAIIFDLEAIVRKVAA